MPLALPVLRFVPVLALGALSVAVPVSVLLLVFAPVPVPVSFSVLVPVSVLVLPIMHLTLVSALLLVPVLVLSLQLLLEVRIPASKFHQCICLETAMQMGAKHDTAAALRVRPSMRHGLLCKIAAVIVEAFDHQLLHVVSN